MSPLDTLWYGILSLLQPLITPDWGKLVVVIPYLLVLVILASFGLIARAWFRLLRAEPVRGPKVRRPDYRPKIAGHLAVIGVGVVTVVLAFVAGSKDPSWTGAQSPAGLVVNVPLLILGLALMIGAVGNAVRLWDRLGRDDVQPDILDNVTAAMRRHPARSRRVLTFIAGFMLAATGMLAGVPPGPTPMPMPVAFVPLLILGLLLMIWATGSATAALWPSDPDFDPEPDSRDTALVAAHH
jgi:hypothetical protein